MVEDERYAVMRHGLFPRFVLSGFVFAFAGILLQLLVAALLPVSSANFTNIDLRNAISLAYFPCVFVLFYLSSRIRVNLSRDYAAVAASIFIGALGLSLLYGLPEALLSGQSEIVTTTDMVLQGAASSVSQAIDYTFVGFAAIMLSYRRRM